MIPTQAGDQPRDAPAVDPEEYMQPAFPQVLVAFDPPSTCSGKIICVFDVRLVVIYFKFYNKCF